MTKVSKVKQEPVTALAEIGEVSVGLKRHAIMKSALDDMKRQKSEPFVVTDLSGLGIGISNIKDLKDQKSLALAWVATKRYFSSLAEGIADLGWEAEDDEVRLGGGTEETWKKVFQKQYSDITQDDKIKELEELVKEGELFVKEEEKEALHLEKVKKFAEKYAVKS